LENPKKVIFQQYYCHCRSCPEDGQKNVSRYGEVLRQSDAHISSGKTVELALQCGRQEFSLGEASPGDLGHGTPLVGPKGEALVGDLEAEAIGRDTFESRNDQHLKMSHNSPPDS